MISDIKHLREGTYDLTSNLKEDISTLQKKIDTLKVEFDNINQYEHEDGLVISYRNIKKGGIGEVIPCCYSTPI